MKIRKITPFLFLASAMLIASCGPTTGSDTSSDQPASSSISSEEPPVVHTATFKNGETVLATYQVNHGQYATYSGATPTKDSTAAESFSFSGWDKDPATTPIVEDTVFTAQFNSTPVQYTVTFKNGDTTLATYQVNYGDYATYSGAVPTKDATAAETYTFSGWDKDPATTAIVANTTFIAQFSSTPVQYSATFKNGDTVLATYYVNYGGYAVYDGATPTKASSGNTEYTFSGWDKDPATTAITANTIFNAQFNEVTYTEGYAIDNFEGYETANDVADEWTVSKWANNAWTTTTATIGLSANTSKDGGKQAAELSYWLNTTGFKYSKAIAPTNIAANAIKFTFKGREGGDSAITVRMEGETTVAGNKLTPEFDYKCILDNDSYVTYTIPFAATGWTSNYDQGLGISGDSINTLCSQYGFKANRLANMMKGISFMLKGNLSGGPSVKGLLDNIEFVNTDATTITKTYEVELQSVYTGTLADGETVVKLSVNGDKSATLETLNLETNLVVPGKVVLEGANLSFVSADEGASLTLNASVKTSGKSLKFISASGTYASSISGLDMTAVDVLDDFDSYTETGTPYYQGQKDPSKRTGIHTGWFADYYSGGSGSPVGGNGWSLMGGSGDQLTLKTNGGHSGNNYASLKHSTAGAMRYMTWGLSDGTSTAHSGKTLSFYAKNSGEGAFNLYVYAYYQSQVTASTQQTNRTESGKIAIAKTDTEWTHYTVTLDPNKTYYGVSFLLKEGSTTSYLHLDDVEIYSADPHAAYTPAPVVETLPEGTKFSGSVNGQTAYLSVGAEGAVTLDATNLGMGKVDGTISGITDNKVTVTIPGVATFTGTLDADRYSLVIDSVTGTYASLFEGGKFCKVYSLDNFESYAANGTPYYQSQTDASKRSGIYTGWFADYYSGGSGSPVGGNGWSLMGGDGSQIKLKTDGGHTGSKYATMKSNSSSLRYMTWGLVDGSATAMRGNTLSFWMKSKGSAQTTVNVYVYFQQQVTPSTQQLNRVQLTATLATSDTEWKEYKVVLNDTLTFYGLSVMPKSSSENWIYVDDIEVRTEDLSISSTVNYTGTIGGQSVTATFNADKTCALDLTNLGAGVLTGSYTISGSIVTATYNDGSTIVARIGNAGTSLIVISGTGLGANAKDVTLKVAA